jgi:hypothetical protein
MAGKREIKTTLALDGEQKFKKAMSDAASAIKELNSEQKLAEAQFEATGDAEQYAADKTRILKSKIEEQQKVVKAAEDAVKEMKDKGVEPNSRAMLNWRSKVNMAKTSLTNMQTQLDKTETELSQQGTALDNASTDAGEYKTAIDKAAEAVDFTATITAIDNVRNTIGTIITTAGRAAKAMINLERGAAGWADELATNAAVAGLDVVEYQGWEYASQLIDSSVDTIRGAYKRLNKNLDEPTDDILLSLNELKVANLEVGGSARDTMDVFWDVIDAMGKIENTSRRDQLAMELFGKSYDDLLPLINAGSQAYKDFIEEGKKTAVSEENINKLTDLDDTLVKLQAQFDDTKYTLLAQLAPAFQSAAEAATAALGAFNEFLNSEEGQESLNELKDAITSISDEVGATDWKTAMENASTIIRKIVSGLSWLISHSELVVGAVGGLAAAWAALTVSKDVLSVLQLLNTIKWARIARFAASGGGAAGAGAAGAGAAGAGAAGAGAAGAGGNLSANIVSKLQSGAKAVTGFAELAAIAYSFAWAAKERLTNPEIRGSVGALESQMGDNDELKVAFLKYAKAQKDLQDYVDSSGPAGPEVDALLNQVEATEKAFHAIEGWQDVMKAYSDWRQENSYGNMNWAVPEELGSAEDALAGVAEKLATTKQEMDGLTVTADNYADSVQGVAAQTGKMEEAAENLGKTAQAVIRDSKLTVGNVDKDLVDSGVADIAKGVNPYATAAKMTWQSVVQFFNPNAGGDAVADMAAAIEDNADKPVAAAESVASDIGAELDSVDGYGAGYATGLGFAKGIDDTYELAVGAAEAMGDAVAARLRWVLQVRSPSKVMHKIGAFASLGFAKGIEDNVTAVERATGRMAQATMGRAISAQPAAGSRRKSEEMVHLTLVMDGKTIADDIVPYVDGILSAKVARRR